MKLLDQIRKDQLTARKNRESDRASLLTTLIGEAVMIGKNDGNRETTDAEVVSLIKKFIKNTEETYFAMADREATQKIVDKLQFEKQILESYLPKQLSEEEIRKIVTESMSYLSSAGSHLVGHLMRLLKEQYPGQYDGKLASKVVKEIVEERDSHYKDGVYHG